PSIPSPLFLIHPSTPPISTLSLHDALPISAVAPAHGVDELDLELHPEVRAAHRSALATARLAAEERVEQVVDPEPDRAVGAAEQDRKSTRLNSSHQIISYAVFCLKKKKHK